MQIKTTTLIVAVSVLQISYGSFLNSESPTRIARVACVGDSITFGADIADRERNSYPSVLQRLLGSQYNVHNFGVSGANLIKKGDKPYWQEQAFSESTRFNCDVVIIILGTNDTKPQNWRYKAEFTTDYLALIERFASLPSKPKIWLCVPPPIFKENWGINQAALDQLMPMMQQIAKQENLPLIDLYTSLSNHPDYFADGIHPNEKGAGLIAHAVYDGIISDNNRK